MPKYVVISPRRLESEGSNRYHIVEVEYCDDSNHARISTGETLCGHQLVNTDMFGEECCDVDEMRTEAASLSNDPNADLKMCSGCVGKLYK